MEVRMTSAQTPAGPQLGILPGDNVLYRGQRVDLVLRALPTSSGTVRQREVLVHPGAVIILPVLDDGRVVMIRNRRHTVLDELWELAAGTLEKGEDPAICAARELTEETGYTADRLESLGWFYTSPGILTEKMYAFVARGLTAGSQDLEENEQIKVEPKTQEELHEMIQTNQIVDAKTIATLLKFFTAK